MTEKVTTTNRYIYKCSNKDCNNIYALEFDVTYFLATKQYTYKMINTPEWAKKVIEDRPYLRMPGSLLYARNVVTLRNSQRSKGELQS